MAFLTWLEATSFGDWARSSLLGYPLLIGSHAIGMSIMVGLALALDMRVLGLFKDIPYTALNRFLGIAWAGFAINFLSGTGLFVMQATTYITDGTFLLKMALVFGGVITAGLLQSAANRSSASWSGGAPGAIRLVAVVSVVCWVGATVTGRLIAYL